jgi:hypothetical protein
MIINKNEKYQSRAYTNKLIEAMDCGEIDPQTLAENLLAWISEDTAQEFAEFYEYITEEDEEEEEEEENGEEAEDGEND